ncbi:MAG: glycosyltransferase family 2 protein [Bacteroidota bacterium]
MKLSVIIVNYNVRHFLEQCLHSVFKSIGEINAEVFVVDNNSVDGSCHIIREKFPQARLIENKKNTGFSVANNQAIRVASGQYVLLLNPDTVVEEDTFSKVIAFMDQHPEAGGLGVKMIDGKGRFLPESKRGLPTPWVAFYKIFGISTLFPRSKRFGRYHLSYLNKDETHEVDILCGAFMLLRKETLEKTGLLDETFFMYGEDIDLSYRITKAGYKNYYFAGTTIIHYKGESTKKGSINYVKMFYNAMLIFSGKHFSSGNYRIYSLFIHLAIYFRAFIAVVQRIIRRIYLPVFDFLLMFAGFLLIVPLWERIMFEPGHFPSIFFQWAIPAYILTWLAGIQFSGGYRKPVSLLRISRGLLWGTIAILLAYSLIDEDYRFSRAVILFGAAWAILTLPLMRLIFSKLKISGFELDIESQKKVAIVGNPQEVKRIKDLLHQTPVNPLVVGSISVKQNEQGDDLLGHVGQIRDIIGINNIEEIIFCAGSLSSGEIIRTMLDLSSLDIAYKIAPPESFSIIGSNSIHTAGDLYLVDVNAISRKPNRRKKRLLDLILSSVLLITLPVNIWFFRNKKQLLSNLLRVLKKKQTWVGYIPDEYSVKHLPILPDGVINQGFMFKQKPSQNHVRQLNILYAKDYRIWNDLLLISRNWRKLDNCPNG